LRFIYILLLGMLIFNGMLIIFSPFFPAETLVFNPSAVDPGVSHGTYANLGNQNLIGDMILTSGGIFAAAMILAVVTQSVIWVGAGSFIAFIAGLWVGISQPITGIIGYFSVAGVSLYSLFMICVGIIVTASVIEMFVQQKGAG